MKTAFQLYIITIFFGELLAQHNDNTWLLSGFVDYLPPNGVPGVKIEFDGDETPIIEDLQLPFHFRYGAIYSNDVGTLKLYSNGCAISDGNHDMIAGSQSLNEGDFHDDYCPSQGYPYSTPVLIKKPIGKGYYLFYGWDELGVVRKIQVTELEEGTNGDMKITSINQPIITDTLSEVMAATKHANGRDWWIVVPEVDMNFWSKLPDSTAQVPRYYTFLVDPAGIHGPYEQRIGWAWHRYTAMGQALFSPDGSKFIIANPVNGLIINDFDRCTGKFTKSETRRFWRDVGAQINCSGAAVSSNNRFLYFTHGDSLLQYDFEAANFDSSFVLIDTFDGFTDPLPQHFFQMNLAPNGLIYMSARFNGKTLSTIHEPDKKGKDCNFKQHDLPLPQERSWFLPYFPHYRTGALQGSGCDTLGSSGLPGDQEFGSLELFPNSASETVSLNFPGSALNQPHRVRVFNAMGQMLLAQEFEGQSGSLSVKNLPVGLLFVQVHEKRGLVASRKLAIER